MSQRQLMPTKAELDAAIQVVIAIADTIRELGRVPNGHLYAMLTGRMSLRSYTIVIEKLKATGLVKEVAHELIWVGPAVEA